MMGCYDFCGYYEWTFDWLERVGGHEMVRTFWDAAIHRDSQRHAQELIQRGGFSGMAEYWGATLVEESPDLGFTITQEPEVFRIDMHDCPSRGFLLRNNISAYSDYCDHCMGWIGPLMREAGYVIDHEHNHCGQCWWEMRPRTATGPHDPPGQTAGTKDVRFRPEWLGPSAHLDRYTKAVDPDAKMP